MEKADIVVIDGDVLGGAVAYYLAKQAAGLLTCGRFKSHSIPLVLETYRAIDEIGFIRLMRAQNYELPRFSI